MIRNTNTAIENAKEPEPPRIISISCEKISSGADKMNDKKTALALKKQTLTAWTKILLNGGSIDVTKCSRMLALIDKLSA